MLLLNTSIIHFSLLKKCHQNALMLFQLLLQEVNIMFIFNLFSSFKIYEENQGKYI